MCEFEYSHLALAEAMGAGSVTRSAMMILSREDLFMGKARQLWCWEFDQILCFDEHFSGFFVVDFGEVRKL